MNDSKNTRASDRSIVDVEDGEAWIARVVDGHVESEALLGGRREILIRHDHRTYHLRLTGQNKLILTK